MKSKQRTSHLLIKYMVILIVLFVYCNNLFANSKLDSLIAQLKYVSDDRQKVDLLLKCSALAIKSDRESALINAKEALSISQKTHYKSGKAEAFYQLGRILQSSGDYTNSSNYYNQASEAYKVESDFESMANSLRKSAYVLSKEGNLQEALDIYRSTLILCEEHNIASISAKILSGISGIYRSQGLYQKALQHGLEALGIQKELQLKKDLPYTLDRIGVIYRSLKDYDEALNYYQQSLAIREANPNTKAVDIAYSLMVIGDIFLKKEDMDSAFQHFEKARIMYEGVDDKEGIAFCLGKLGDVEAEKENDAAAFQLHKKSLDIYLSINHKAGISSSYLNLVDYYYGQDDIVNAESYANKLLEISSSIGKEAQVVFAYEKLALIHEKKNDSKKALHFQKLYLTNKDSLWNYEKTKEMTKMQSSYDMELLELHSEKLQEENAKKQALLTQSRTRMIALSVVMLLLLGMLSMLVKAYKNKIANNRVLQQKNQVINDQKEQVIVAKDNLKNANDNLEVKIKDRTAALKRSNEELEKFAYLASHDLKHPLRNIIGFSQLLERDLKAKDKLDDTASEYIGIVIKGTKYMNDLIEDILEFSKFSLSKDNKFESFNFEEVMKVVLAALKTQVEESKAEIELVNLSQTIIGVRVKVIQMMQNILSNSLKFRNANEPLKVKIEVNEKDAFWQFDITDNGIGIDEKYHEIIFELFKQINNKQEYAGSGMGLAIAQKIAEQHKGDIWVDSKFGEGTTISFTISKDLANVSREVEVMREIEKV